MLREIDSHATDFTMRYFCRYLVGKNSLWSLFIVVLSVEADVLLPVVIKAAINKHRTNERTNMLQSEPSKTFTDSLLLSIFWSVRKTGGALIIAAYITYFTRKWCDFCHKEVAYCHKQVTQLMADGSNATFVTRK